MANADYILRQNTLDKTAPKMKDVMNRQLQGLDLHDQTGTKFSKDPKMILV